MRLKRYFFYFSIFQKIFDVFSKEGSNVVKNVYRGGLTFLEVFPSSLKPKTVLVVAKNVKTALKDAHEY